MEMLYEMQILSVVQVMAGYVVIEKDALIERINLIIVVLCIAAVAIMILAGIEKYYEEKEKEKKEREREERIVAEIKKSDTSGRDDNVDMLKKLAELHEKGILTDDEFEQKKGELLDRL